MWFLADCAHFSMQWQLLFISTLLAKLFFPLAKRIVGATIRNWTKSLFGIKMNFEFQFSFGSTTQSTALNTFTMNMVGLILVEFNKDCSFSMNHALFWRSKLRFQNFEFRFLFVKWKSGSDNFWPEWIYVDSNLSRNGCMTHRSVKTRIRLWRSKQPCYKECVYWLEWFCL